MVKMIKKEKITDGLVEELYDNGQLKRRGNRKNGKENRLWETFYEYGQLSQKGSLIDGKQEGPFEYYYKNSQLFNRGSFKTTNKKASGIILMKKDSFLIEETTKRR